jgi:hypothetical protein
MLDRRRQPGMMRAWGKLLRNDCMAFDRSRPELRTSSTRELAVQQRPLLSWFAYDHPSTIYGTCELRKDGWLKGAAAITPAPFENTQYILLYLARMPHHRASNESLQKLLDLPAQKPALHIQIKRSTETHVSGNAEVRWPIANYSKPLNSMLQTPNTVPSSHSHSASSLQTVSSNKAIVTCVAVAVASSMS